MFCLLLFSLFGPTNGSFDYSGRATLDDLYSFFVSTGKIYLYKRSYSRLISGNEPQCIVNERAFLNSTNLSLVQRYSYGGRGVYYFVSATLSAAELPDHAPIIEATGPRGSIKCELHIWEEKVKDGPSENCEREYKFLCPKQKAYKVFNDKECMP
uniref:Lipocalin-2 1 n=1 Tax=Amblyomma triste TaxID=251400 RepID=A0A023GCD4_AMBTT